MKMAATGTVYFELEGGRKSMNTEIFFYRDIECLEKESIRRVNQDLKVYDKSTASSRARSRKALERLEAATESETKNIPTLNWALAFAKCCQSDKQSIADYISEEKELFLLEYSVKVKQRTMAKLEKMAAKEERRAKIAETKLEEDTLAFEEFLRENDKCSVEALKMATQEAKSKLEVTTELRSAMNDFLSFKSDIANTEDLLKLYFSYEVFLFSISPKEWQEQQLARRIKVKKEKKRGQSKSILSFQDTDKAKMSSSSLLNQRLNKWVSHKGSHPAKKILAGKSASVLFANAEERKKYPQSQGDYRFFRKPSHVVALDSRSFLQQKIKLSESYSSERSVSSEEDFSLEDLQNCEEVPEIYFKDPEELLQMYRHLEEQNLSLFQNIQDISGMLEESLQREKMAKQHMGEKIKRLKDEKEALIAACLKEDAKCAELALNAKEFSSGKYNSASMNKVLGSLTKKLAEVYSVCCGVEEVSNLSPFQMLKKLEIRVSELCEMLETLPKEYLEIIEVTEKLRAKERRQKVREDKLKELRRIQEERLKHALERAIAEPKKRVGRKLVYRSLPPKTNKESEHVTDPATKGEDDYYFT